MDGSYATCTETPVRAHRRLRDGLHERKPGVPPEWTGITQAPDRWGIHAPSVLWSLKMGELHHLFRCGHRVNRKRVQRLMPLPHVPTGWEVAPGAEHEQRTHNLGECTPGPAAWVPVVR
jgi:hypothetical protein